MRSLDALDKLLAAQPYDGPARESHGEFTLYDYIAQYEHHHGVGISNPGANKKLSNMVKDGTLTVRKGRVNGKQGNIYAPTKQ